MKLKKAISCILAATMISSIAPAISLGAAADGIDTGLIAHYDFETDAAKPGVIADVSGKGNDAAVLNNGSSVISVKDGIAYFPGCTTLSTQCIPGAALKLPNDFNRGVKDFTFSAWVNADSSYEYATPGNMSRIFDFGNIADSDTYNSIFARYTVESGLLRVQDRASSGAAMDITPVGKVFTDKWGLLTVTFKYNRSTSSYSVSAYVNGQSVLESSDGLFKRSLDDLGILNDRTNGLFIGRTVWSVKPSLLWENPDFCGKMDDIRIYNRALSAAEAQYLYENTSPERRKITGYVLRPIYTVAGTAPVLPAMIEVTYNIGASEFMNVTWEKVSPAQYASVGSFTVKGVIDGGMEAEANVIVKGSLSGDTLSDGLILHYTFDSDESEPFEITDTSGCGNDASVVNTGKTVNGTLIENNISIENGVAVFPGNTSVSGNEAGGAALKLPNNFNQGVTDFTYSAWVKADTSDNYSSRLQRFFDFGNASSTTNSIFFRYTVSSGNARLQDRFVGMSANDSQSLVSATLSDKPFSGKWALLTLTYEKSGTHYIPKIYINGEKRSEFKEDITTLTRSLDDLGVLTDSTNGLWIGRTQWNDYANPDFCGKMDDIRIYNRALGENEVLGLYLKSAPSEEPRGDTVVTIRSVDETGKLISSSETSAYSGERFVYTVEKSLIAWNGDVYAFSEADSSLEIESVGEDSAVTAVYKKADSVLAEQIQLMTYTGAPATLPKNISVTADSLTARLPVSWSGVSSFSQKGVYTVSGTITGTDRLVSAQVTVFPECAGQIGGDLTINIYADGKLKESIAPKLLYGEKYTLPESYRSYLGLGYIFDRIDGDISEFGQSITADRLYQTVNLYFKSNGKLNAELDVHIKANYVDNTSYNLSIEANILNLEEKERGVILAIASYDSEGAMTLLKTERITAEAGKETSFEKTAPYTAADDNKVIYLWSDTLVPLSAAVKVGALEKEGVLDETLQAMLPSVESAESAIRSANGYWQGQINASSMSYTWDSAAYHTGNIEAYKLLGEEDYLNYATDWANARDWGTPDNIDEFFGDNQTCFQTYIDLYNLGVNGASVDKVLDVMERQTATSSDSYWHWADALYMVMPVMTKLYNLTGEKIYLDRLYEWFKYAKELMYDGKGGIPTDPSGYTTSAGLKWGAQYSDPENYANLFYRDANYVYPLRPNSGHEDEKNFWARGNGWVFAALAKVLSDVPETWEHYDEFYTTYVEMAASIRDCQVIDENGCGFWTQSMLQNYPTGENGNDYGYETSGTAFFTYGLFWGINNGILDENEYIEAAVRGWGYLENVALQPSGKVGYVQHIGSQATEATPASSTLNFGVGAFLLACCEAARWSAE